MKKIKYKLLRVTTTDAPKGKYYVLSESVEDVIKSGMIPGSIQEIETIYMADFIPFYMDQKLDQSKQLYSLLVAIYTPNQDPSKSNNETVVCISNDLMDAINEVKSHYPEGSLIEEVRKEYCIDMIIPGN